MADFVALGLQGADKLVDKHFHKIPDKYMNAETYLPGKRNNNNSNNRSRSSSPHSNAETEEDSRMIKMQDNERRGGNNRGMPYDNDGPNNNPYYGHAPPTDRYPKTKYPYENYTGLPPLDDDRPRGRPRYESALAYPRASSFSPPPRYRSPDRDRRRPQDDSIKPHRHRSRHRPSDAFSTSKKGIAGGALGAVVAGWATHAALEAHGRGQASVKDRRVDKAITVLGAVAGGLAANSMVDYLEDGRKDTSDEQKKWEEKFGSIRVTSRSKSRARERGYDERWS